MTTIELIGEKSVVQLDLEGGPPSEPTIEHQGVVYMATDNPLRWMQAGMEETDGEED